MMVGAMTATTVGFPLNWTLNIGETSIVVSELFDAIYPGILSLALVLFMMWRIKKGNRPHTADHRSADLWSAGRIPWNLLKNQIA